MCSRSEIDRFLLDISVEKLEDNNSYNDIKKRFLECFTEFIGGYNVKQENPYHIYTVGDHTLYSIANSDRNLVVRWVLALHDIGKPVVKTYDENGVAHFYLHHLKSMDIADSILDKYNFNKKEKELILKLIKNHDRDIKSKSSIRRLLKELSIEEVNLLLDVKNGDAKAQNTSYIKERVDVIEIIRKKLYEIVEEDKRFKVSDLNITGKELIEIGITEGKDIGYILNTLYKLVIEDKILNKKEILCETSLKIWKKIQ